MNRILFAAAVLIGSFYWTAPAFGQCENGVCRRPIVAAATAPAKVVAGVGVGAVRGTAAVVRGTARGVAKVGLGAAKIVALPAKAMRQVACNCQERRCERRAQRGPIFPRFRTRRCF